MQNYKIVNYDEKDLNNVLEDNYPDILKSM